MNKIIKVENLVKSYGDVKAVRGIDFYVEEGKLFSFLGPNGAGKSTTIDIICTFLKAESGTITIDGNIVGKDDDKIRNLIGVVFQQGVLDDILTVEENLKCRGSLYNLNGAKLKESVYDIANITGITSYLKRPYGKLSGGQKRRCDIARALIHQPKILFLDEPTTGLDPQTRKYVWDMIENIKNKTNMTIFLTTHYMEEANNSDYMVVMDNGIVVAKGTPTEMKAQYSSDKLSLYAKDFTEIEKVLCDNNVPYKKLSNTVEIEVKTTMETLPLIELVRAYVTAFEVTQGTMDNVFLNITGKELRE